MLRPLILAVTVAILHAPVAAQSPPMSLFNGADLTGWRVHGTELWYVENGELVCESGLDEAYGYLVTNRTFRDFDLTLDFLQEADGNSGVFFRAGIEGGRISGWQAEVASLGLYTGGIYESYGRGWLIQPDAAKGSALRIGEWNSMRIRVVGDEVTTWLNGVEMVSLSDELIGQAGGSIALQIHDGGGIKIRWKNLYVRELGQEPSPDAPPFPLFASHEPLNLRLVADFDEITDDRSQDSEESAGTAIVTTPDGSSFTVPVQIRTRGNFRLQSWVCPFPPLRLDFPTEEVGGSVLSGQDKLKMVTHCRDRDRYEQNVLKEFLVYRFFNQLTDRSFKVRLARMTYVDTGSRGRPVTRWGFLIEDEDRMAARLGGEILEVEELHPARILGVNAATVTIFQFMVGNTDFSLYRDHNTKLVETADQGVIAVPYDFDWTGLVDTPYAIPDPRMGSRSVRQRIFRGLCRSGVDYAEHYRQFREAREAIEALVESQQGLTEETAEDVLDYLNEFYEIVGNEKAARQDIEEDCRPV